MRIKSLIGSKLDKEIITLLDKLETTSKDTEEYAVTVEHIAKLHKLKTEESLKPPSLETVLVVGANLFGIIWLANYEREHVITSKAINFVMKPRI